MVLTMASVAELDTFARSLPEVEVRYSRTDRPEYRVNGKLFAVLRDQRKDAIDPETGAPMDDVIAMRVPDLVRKDELLADPSLPLFTTPHFDGWPYVLLRARHLGEIASDVLRELVVEAWSSQAPKRLARDWRAAQAEADD